MSSATPAPNKTLNTDTPHHSKSLYPVSLFPANDIPLIQQEDIECEPSSSVTLHEEGQGDVSVDFNLHDGDLDSVTAKTTLNLQTKTA